MHNLTLAMNSIVILLTGTIKPMNVDQLVLSSPEKREQEYLNAITKWVKLGYPVIFCENSNFDSALINNAVKNINASMFEYLKFTTTVSHLGKGNGEVEIIDYVFNNSSLVKEHTIICKATGKNYILNAGKLIKKIMSPEYANKLVIANLTRRLTWADSRIYFFTKKFYYAYWLSYSKTINEPNKIFFEHALAKAIHTALANDEGWAITPYAPLLQGYSGTWGKKYKSNIFARIFKSAFHAVKVKMFDTSK
jgi:hypothetical protein